MTVQRLADFPLAELIPMLTSQGWDCSLRETLTAHYDGQGFGELRLVVDRSGRAILRRTTLESPSEERLVRGAHGVYAVQQETLVVRTVMTTLAAPEDFEVSLAEMMSLASARSEQAAETGE